MAEIVSATVAVTSAVLKLGKVLYNQANFLLGVKDGVEQLQSELRWMKSFLNDAETKIDNNNLIRQWVSDVRDLAYEAEDVIDTFLLKFGPETQSFTCRHCISFTINAPTTHKLGHELEKLRKKSIEISSRPHRYGLNADASSSRKSDEKLKELRASTPYANNDYMVGLAETVSRLKAKLTDVRSGRSVISIHGMGGLGKTTLARKLYNELRPSQFSYHAWVCVSQEYDTEDILRQVIKSMGNPTDPQVLANKGSMEVYLRNKLSGSSFLVVIDDVWDVEAWESLERAFPDDCTKGRVIITTRFKHVAEAERHSGYVHELRFLYEDESWELFCKETFKYDTTMKCPSNLEQLGKEMVAKCSGLPLALVTLGGILSTKPHISTEWEWVKLNLWKELEKNSIHIDAVLALSFKELPDYLKLCFLYVGMFPEDFEIPIWKLMSLWESEGFFIGCEEEEQATPEDIAKSYFNELVGRNLLQKTGEDWINSVCRVHDLVRALAINQAKEIKFCAFYGERQKNDLLNVPSSQRKLAMHLSIQNMPSDFGNRSLRTLHLDLWKGEGYRSEFSVPVNKLLQSLHRRFHLLRVLDIDTFGRMPHLQVDKLINLRYLSLKFGEPFKLPETLGHLKELQTLYVSSRDCVKLPKSLGQLRCLKHLRGKFRCRSGGIGKLTGLQTLEIHDDKTWCCLPLETLVHLRHLSLEVYIFPEFLPKFGSLKRLQKLVLKMGLTPEILEIFKHCRNITHFKTWGLFNFPGLSAVAANLQVIELLNQHAEDFSDAMSELQKLHVLRALRMYVLTFQTVHLVCVCSDVGFPQLRTLHIKLKHCGGIFGHVKFSVAEGGLPVLTNLHVDEPDKLIAPDRLKQLISAAP